MKKVSEYKRYKDGMWIPHLKRTYLYWFKFLQECERSSEHKVNWKKYKSWGSSNYILGVKFDEFWLDNWKELFGVKKQGDIPKCPLSTPSPKNESIRICWLIWLFRNTPTKRRSNTFDIAEKILKTEKRSATHNTIYTWDLSDDRNPNTMKDVQTLINRYKRQTKVMMENVCVGKFP